LLSYIQIRKLKIRLQNNPQIILLSSAVLSHFGFSTITAQTHFSDLPTPALFNDALFIMRRIQDDAEGQCVTGIAVSSLFYCEALQSSNFSLE